MSLAGAKGGERMELRAPSPCPATFFAAVGGNDVFWRCQAPAKAIGAKVVTIPEQEMEYALTVPNMDSPFRWTFDPDTVESTYPDLEGTAVWIRPDPARSAHAQAMREQGTLFVAEVDDNYLSNPRLNIFQRSQGYGADDRDLHIRSMFSADRIVFSTRVLLDIYHQAFKRRFGKRKPPELVVCRNNIDLQDWPEPIPTSGPLRVGWMGSPSHIWDVDLAWNALLHARKQGCEVTMIGYDPTLPEGQEIPAGLRTPRSQAKIDAWKKVRYTHIPWQKPDDHHRTALPLDIGLCPLQDNEHTRGKSDVKAIEYGIAGAAVIAQNTPVYNQTLVHGETALLVRDEREMLHAVDILIHDENLRLRLVNNLRRYIYEERGLKQLRQEWLTAVDPS